MDPYREPAPREANGRRRLPLAYPPLWFPLEPAHEVVLVWLGSLAFALVLATCGR